MALAIVAIVAFGFGRTIDAKLIHPPAPRPTILYVHALLSATWVSIFLAQTLLIANGVYAWHRRVGIAGLVVGGALPVVGAITAVAMAAINLRSGFHDAPAFLVLPIFYMLSFAAIFGLAVVAIVRRTFEIHRRLMFIATCLLTVAAFARFPGLPVGTWDVFTDALIVCGAMRDYIVTKTIHPVYRFALPLLVAGQIAANAIYFTHPSWWLGLAHAMMHA
ncbi:MAG: hypothetical protein JO199_11795 [Candidatus Eremiobacteraeota bacterium]|nr:hypothetical protein [Candidatus Eremiobacteraeota bacterium]